MGNNFIFPINNNEKGTIHLKIDNIEIMINDEADEVILESFDSFIYRYQNNIE